MSFFLERTFLNLFFIFSLPENDLKEYPLTPSKYLQGNSKLLILLLIYIFYPPPFLIPISTLSGHIAATCYTIS